MLPVAEIATRGERIIDEVERAVVGKREALELVDDDPQICRGGTTCEPVARR